VSDGDHPTDDPLTRQVSALQSLGFLLGRWRGRGWTMTRDGRVEFEQHEWVRTLLGGSLMTVEGRATGPGEDVEKFSAFAVVTFDPTTAAYGWRAYSAGHCLDVELQVGEQTFGWGFEVAPGVHTRFEADVSGDVWHEVGHVSTDGGATWTQTFEMSVARVSDPDSDE
jgi:hypothetical protein